MTSQPQIPAFPRPGKAPISVLPTFPSIKETKSLEKKVKVLQRQQQRQAHASEYDDLNDLSDDDSYSSSLDGFVVRDRRRHNDDDSSVQDLGASSEEEEDDYTSSSGVSGSIHSDDDEEAEEEEAAARRRLAKKRKLEVAPVVPAKEPRLAVANQRVKQATAAETARVESLHNKVTLQLQELERVNATIAENLKIVEEATALLEKKEAARTEEALFVLNHEKLKKDLETQEANLRRREAELQLTVNTAHQLEAQLVTRATELETRETALLEDEKELVAREKAIAALPKPKPPTMTPLDGFLLEMQKSNQHLISREDMCGIVPANLMSSLAYLGSKQQLKYHSVVNSQYLIVEVTGGETGQPLMRQIVSKQLYNAK